MRIACIRIAVELECRATETLENFINEKSRSAVCRIKHNTQFLLAHMNTRNNRVYISIANVNHFILALFALGIGRVKKRINFFYIVRLKRFRVSARKLEARPTVRIVACGYHNKTFAFEIILSKI